MAENPSVLDRALDEIVADRSTNQPRGDRGDRNGRRRGGGNRTPRDGVSKQTRPLRDPGRGNWAHDKFSEVTRDNSYHPRDDGHARDQRSSKIRVENLHYDLGEPDLRDVFSRVGEIRRIDIIYDKAGRSEGIATVLYTTPEEAMLAVDQFDGANAKGQPIRVKIAPLGGRRGAPPAANEGRSLFDRVAGNPQDEGDDRRARQQQQRRDIDEMRQNARDLGIDRYIPGDRNGSRDRRPRRGGMGGERERHRGGRGEGRGRGGRGGGRADGDGERSGPTNRPRKTAEELDAEMNDYWGANGGDTTVQSAFAPGGAAGGQAQPGMGSNTNNFMNQVDATAQSSAIEVDEDL